MPAGSAVEQVTMPKKKIAILGGGIGAMAAAFELTRQPNWSDRYEVAVYQLGWRLGGKCATGRNATTGQRIEEHGIHFLLGFYENAFRMIRDLYGQYIGNFPSPFKSWHEAFRNQDTVTAMYQDGRQWLPFGVTFPRLPGEPGDFTPGDQPPAPWSYIAMILKWMKGVIADMEQRVKSHMEDLAQPAVSLAKDYIPELREAVKTGWSAAKELLDRTENSLKSPVDNAYNIASRHAMPPPSESNELSRIIDYMNDLSASLSTTMSSLDTSLSASGANQTLILFDVAAAIVRGMIRDGVIFDGFKNIDGHELTAWLAHHGCRHPDSTIIRSGYDACFAYAQGDAARPEISAGVGLHGALRLWFTYKDAIFRPMEAGMAEVIFTPMYRVLQSKGVKFYFFHRVTKLHLSADRKTVQSIDIDVQAAPKDGETKYWPFVTVKGLECWPNQPRYDQLVNGDSLRNYDLESAWNAPGPVSTKQLVQGTHFDEVILGIPVGALRPICQELIAASNQWKNMVDRLPTVQTQAMQLWLNTTATQLGYHAGTPFPTSNAPCVSSFVEPYDTYVDMSPLKDREDWQESDRVSHLAYFCNALPESSGAPAPGTDSDFPRRQWQSVKDNSKGFLGRDILALWPRSHIGSPGFNWEFLVAPANVHGPQRFDYQYFRANIDPSARYVLSPPGTLSDRLDPAASGFANLFLAGDWTLTPLSSGCVEAATMAGLRAARALSGNLEEIYGWT
jgi:uncharacterized protein with NAD-binding domain and iron-sulfur cluster